MKKKIFIGFLVLLLIGLITFIIIMKSILPGMTFAGNAAFAGVTSSVDKFVYQPDKVDIGSVYHYVKSNIDGSKPGDVAVYVASNDRLEVFKIYPGSNSTFFVTTELDWSTFSSRELDGYNIYKDGTKKLVAHGSLSKDANTFEYEVDGKRYNVPAGNYPVHNMNFDFTSLNFTFRHLADPKCEFDIGVHYPSFSLSSMIKFVYSGKAHIKYISDELCNNEDCRKYEISGEGMLGKQGYIWINKRIGCFENVEIPLSDNPSWTSFKFSLAKIDKMSAEEWNQYITSQTKEYFEGMK